MHRSFRLIFIGFDAEKSTDQVAVAVNVVDAGHGGPEFDAAHPFARTFGKAFDVQIFSLCNGRLGHLVIRTDRHCALSTMFPFQFDSQVVVVLQ